MWERWGGWDWGRQNSGPCRQGYSGLRLVREARCLAEYTNLLVSCGLSVKEEPEAGERMDAGSGPGAAAESL